MNRRTLYSLIWAALLSSLALGQTSGGTAATQPDQEGKQVGGYQVQQSIEVGYRFTDVVGSQQVYNTFINQNQGLRVLEQTLNMRALDHSGVLFDRLSASTFGWGGD